MGKVQLPAFVVEASTAMKMAISALVGIGMIIGFYTAVEAWADGKITEAEVVTIERIAVNQAKNAIIHDKIYQTQRVEYSETNLKMITYDLTQLEEEIAEREDEGKRPSASQERKMKRLLDSMAYHEAEVADARAKLSDIHPAEGETQ